MLSYLIYISLLVGSAYGAIPNDTPAVEIHSITNLETEAADSFAKLKAGDIVLFDLDNTIFREVQMLGTDEWFSEMANEIGKPGAEFATKEDLHAMNFLIKNESRMRLMERTTPQSIKKLQRRGVLTIGLTARHPNLALVTNHWLNLFGIDFSLSSFSEKRFRFWQDLDNGREFGFKFGIAFLDGGAKGPMTKHILDFLAYRPGRVVAIDDRIQHVHTFVSTFHEMGLRADVIHYLKVREEPVFDARAAKLQLDAFKQSGNFLSDAQAGILLSINSLCESQLLAKITP